MTLYFKVKFWGPRLENGFMAIFLKFQSTEMRGLSSGNPEAISKTFFLIYILTKFLNMWLSPIFKFFFESAKKKIQFFFDFHIFFRVLIFFRLFRKGSYVKLFRQTNLVTFHIRKKLETNQTINDFMPNFFT